MEYPPQNQQYVEEQFDADPSLQEALLQQSLQPPPGFLQVTEPWEWERDLKWDLELLQVHWQEEEPSLVAHWERDQLLSRLFGDLSEATGDDEANEVGVVGAGEGEMEVEQLNSRCLGYEKFEKKTPGGESGNKETIKVRIASPLKDVLQIKGMILTDAAEELNASAATVDTNNVAGKEIPASQVSPTAQQKNSDEAFGNDEVEEGEIWARRTEEGGIAEAQFDSSRFAKRKRKEKTPRGDKINKKTTGKHLKGDKPSKFKRGARPRQRELEVQAMPSSKKQSKFVKGGTSRYTSRGGLAESNVDVNTAGGQTSSKKWSTSVIGKGVTKIKKPRSTEPTNENKGEVLETAFRSSLRGITMLIKELDLRTCHKEVLKRTPFWRIFEAIIENKLSPKQCRKSDKMIIKIINTYDPVAKIFRLGRESMELTRADMVSMFGISCGNKFVDLKYCRKEKVKLVKRWEISELRLTSKSLKQLLEKYLGSKKKDDIEDVARLLCLYLFHTFLFPTGPTVKWVYLERIEDLDRLRDYDWNKAIINELMSSIGKYHREPRKVTGCVMALLYWLCQHTNLSKPDHPEHPLGIVKWNIPLVVSRLKEIQLKDLKPGQFSDYHVFRVKVIVNAGLISSRVVSRQANVPGTADDEVAVDKDTVQDSVLSGDVPISNLGNDACMGNGKRNEKTTGGERGNNQTTRVRIEIALVDILLVKDVCLKDAVTELKVGRSTLKRVYLDYIPNESRAVADQEQNPQLNFATLLSSNQELASLDTNSVTVKAIYEGETFKFQLSKKPWEMEELKEQVKKRVNVEVQIKYKDEDGDLISIVCNDDLQQYILSSRFHGTTSIVVLLEQKGCR